MVSIQIHIYLFYLPAHRVFHYTICYYSIRKLFCDFLLSIWGKQNCMAIFTFILEQINAHVPTYMYTGTKNFNHFFGAKNIIHIHIYNIYIYISCSYATVKPSVAGETMIWYDPICISIYNCLCFCWPWYLHFLLGSTSKLADSTKVSDIELYINSWNDWFCGLQISFWFM